jgi:xanthine/uracil permease
MLLYRKEFGLRDRTALATYSATALPLVVAITAVATKDHHMTTSTASALVGAAIVSTVVYPFIARALRRERQAEAFPPAAIDISRMRA